MERWDSDKLYDVKTYLKNKDPHSWSRENHYLAIEFVIQRYLPTDEKRTQAQQDAILRNLRAKLDNLIDQPECPNEEFKKDPEFTAFIKETFSTKIDSDEIRSLLDGFYNGDKQAQHKAASLFKRWLQPDGYEIVDEDLRHDMEIVVALWDKKAHAERIRSLDELIYFDVFGMSPGNRISLSYSYYGIPDSELYFRLRSLTEMGVITIYEQDGMVLITSITKSGIDFFNQSLVDKFID